MWLLMVPTLLVASHPLNGLQPLLVVVMSTQVVQVPVLVLLMMVFAQALKVVTLAPVRLRAQSWLTSTIADKYSTPTLVGGKGAAP